MTVFNLDTLAPVGEIPNTRANGAAVDTKSGHGFASSKPVAMWDTKTLALIKTIDIDPKSSPDGILADPFNQRIYVFSHPDGGRDGNRREGRHRARHGRSRRRTGAGGHAMARAISTSSSRTRPTSR